MAIYRLFKYSRSSDNIIILRLPRRYAPRNDVIKIRKSILNFEFWIAMAQAIGSDYGEKSCNGKIAET